jgi:CheY-like chemotaxis protein
MTALPVLLVDDDANSNALVAVALGPAGCRLEIVRSAEQALVAVAAFRPRVVVMDLVQPLMSGLLLAQRLKHDPATRDIVLVALAGLGGPDAERVATEAGFAAYAAKPVEPGAFARTLLAAVEARP